MPILTPDEARTHFGDLTTDVGQHMRVHRMFADPTSGGEWRPVFDETRELLHYRLYVFGRAETVAVTYRPKRPR